MALLPEDTSLSGYAAAMALKSEVKDLLENHWHSSGSRPLFTKSEEIMLAYATRANFDQPRITDEQISALLVARFKRYHSMSNTMFYTLGENKGKLPKEQRDAIKAFALERAQALRSFEMPLVPVSIRRNGDIRYYGCSFAEAQLYVRRLLDAGPEEPFRIMDLPPEIRLIIYEYIFRFPASGIAYDARRASVGSRPSRFLVRYEEKLGWEVSPSSWLKQDSTNCYTTGTASQVLTVLLTSKLIFKEAMPVFYSINHFHADDIKLLDRMLGFCPKERRDFITSISLTYHAPEGTVLLLPVGQSVRCFGVMATMARLRALRLGLRDADFLNGRSASTDIIDTFPQLKALATVRVEELEVVGDCPRIAACLRANMLEKPKDAVADNINVGPKAVAKGRKAKKSKKSAAGKKATN